MRTRAASPTCNTGCGPSGRCGSQARHLRTATNNPSRVGCTVLFTIPCKCAAMFADSVICLVQCNPFVHRQVVALVALYFILRLILARMMRIAFVSNVLCVRLDNSSRDIPSLRIPGNLIADFEFVCHGSSLTKLCLTR